jgi:hypothetical protein
MIKQKAVNIFLQKHKLKIFLAVFCIALVLPLISFTKTASAAVDFNPITLAAGSIIEFTLRLMLKFSGFLLTVAETVFQWIVDPDNMLTVINNPIIYETWRIVRDLLNSMFIMVLLFSAFATIFQSAANYNYKKILFNLVLMALLVNFSYPIARFIVDASNMMMYGTLNGIGGSNSFLTIIDKSGLSKLFAAETSTDTLFLLSAVVFTFIFAITLLVIAVLLVIRTVTIAAYIIFSPIAFVGAILPGTGVAEAGSKWWKDFMQQCLAGPIMVFMLYVATQMITAISTAGGSIANISLKQTPAGTFGANLGEIVAAASFFSIPIVILWIGIIQTQKSGIAGAGAVVGMGTKAMKWSGKHLTGYSAAKYGVKALARKVDRDHIGARAFIKAWKDRSNEVDTDKVASQTATRRDFLGSIFDRGKRDSHFYRDVDDANKIAKYKKEQELFSTTDVDMLAGIQKLSGKKDKESGQRMQAFFQTMAGNKDLNEFEKLQKRNFDPEMAKKNIYDMFRTSLNEEDTIDAMHDLEDTNLMNGVYSMYGLTTIDKTTGKRRLSRTYTDKDGNIVNEQKKAVLGKIKNIDFQKFMINFHPDAVITEDPDGNPIGISDIGKDVLAYVNQMGAEHIARLRGDALLKIEAAINADTKSGGSIAKDNPVLMQKMNEKLHPPIKKGDQDKTEPKIDPGSGGATTTAQTTAEPKPKSEPKIEIQPGGSYSSRGKTTFDDKGRPIT